MNSVQLSGRLTKDPEMRYTSDQLAIASFTIAVDRLKREDADFISVKVFGKQAESCEKYTGKGLRVIVTGRIQTGSYTNREGSKVYTTDVIADRVEFLDWKEKQQQQAFEDVTDDSLPF